MKTYVLDVGAEIVGRRDLRALVAGSLGGEYLDDVQVRGAYLAAMRWLKAGAPATSFAMCDSRIATSTPSSCDGGLVALELATELALDQEHGGTLVTRDIVWIGCQYRMSRAAERELVAALQRGAIVVASDLSARASLLRSLLRPGDPSAPRVARVELRHQLCRDPLLPFLPAIRLSAGHLPLTSDVERTSGCRVLARDAHSGVPIAVLVPVLSGHVLYTSAHWLQNEPVDTTQTGQRPLFTTPVYAKIGHDIPYVSVSEFHAAVAMLSILSAGLATARLGDADCKDVVRDHSSDEVEREDVGNGAAA